MSVPQTEVLRKIATLEGEVSQLFARVGASSSTASISVPNLAALTAHATAGLVGGTTAFVRGGAMGQSYYAWAPADARPVDGYVVVAGVGGNWIFVDNSEAIVFVRPLDGVSDDWPTLMGAIAPAIAGKATLALLPGYQGQAFQCLSPTITCPSSLHLVGQPGVVIQQTLPSPGSGNAAFVNRSTLGADLVLQSDVPVGATSVSVGTSVPAGTHILLQTSTGGQVCEQFVTGAPSGGGPFTLPLDRATMRAYPHTSSTAKVPTTLCQGIRIDGGGMTINATGGDVVFNFSVAFNCEVRDVALTGALGGAAPIVALYDSGSLLCDFTRLRSTMTAQDGVLLASTTKCYAIECDIAGCTTGGAGAGVFLQSCCDSGALNTTTHENEYGVLFGSADALTGCVGCFMRGGSANGNVSHGVFITIGTQATDLDSITTWANGGNGVEIDATVAPCSGTSVRGLKSQYNAGYGFHVATTVTGTVVTATDVSNNVTAGAKFDADAEVDGIVCRGNANGGAGHQAVTVTGAATHVILRGVSFQSALNAWKAIGVQGGVATISGHITCDDGVGFPQAIQGSGTSVIVVKDLTIDGLHAGSNVVGIGTTTATSTLRLGERVNLSACAVPLSLAGPSSKGTVVATGAAGVAVTWPDLNPQDRVSLTMLTPGGSPSAMPAVAYNPGTGFTMTSYAADTSTYGYQVN